MTANLPQGPWLPPCLPLGGGLGLALVCRQLRWCGSAGALELDQYRHRSPLLTCLPARPPQQATTAQTYLTFTELTTLNIIREKKLEQTLKA